MSRVSEPVEYRIEYTIQRRLPGADDFSDIGFGSSGAWDSTRDAAFAVDSAIQNHSWETDGGMPDPESIRAAEEGGMQ